MLIDTHCHRCGCIAQAAAIWLPPGHELLVDDDAPFDRRDWQVCDECRLLHEVHWIDPTTRERLVRLLPNLHAARVEAGICWLNHCEHCGAALAPLEAVHGMIGALCAARGASAPVLTVLPFAEPLLACAGAWTVGDLAEAPLGAIARAAGEATA